MRDLRYYPAFSSCIHQCKPFLLICSITAKFSMNCPVIGNLNKTYQLKIFINEGLKSMIYIITDHKMHRFLNDFNFYSGSRLFQGHGSMAHVLSDEQQEHVFHILFELTDKKKKACMNLQEYSTNWASKKIGATTMKISCSEHWILLRQALV